MTVRQLSTGAGEYELGENQLFSRLRAGTVHSRRNVAEKEGKKVDLLVVPAVDPFDALVQTASRLRPRNW